LIASSRDQTLVLAVAATMLIVIITPDHDRQHPVRGFLWALAKLSSEGLACAHRVAHIEALCLHRAKKSGSRMSLPLSPVARLVAFNNSERG